MFSKKIVLITSLILLSLLPITVYAQIDYNTFFVQKDVYRTGEIVSIQGRIFHDGETPVIIKITDPSGNIIHIDQTMPDANGYFLSNFRIGGLAQIGGQYSVTLDYGDSHGEDTFLYIINEKNSSSLITYNNKEYGFSFQYPSEWDKVILNEREPELNYIAEFYDTQSNVISIMYVQLEKPELTAGTDTQLVNQYHLSLGVGCESMTIEKDDVLCLEHQKLDGYVTEINGIKTVRIVSKLTYDYGDGYPVIVNVDSSIFLISHSNELVYTRTSIIKPTYQNDIDFNNLINSVKINKTEEKLDNSNLFKDPNTEKNIYVNDQYGFSIMPPIGWDYHKFEFSKKSEFDELYGQVFFAASSPNGQELTAPRVLFFMLNTPEFSLDIKSDEEHLKDVQLEINTIIDGVTTKLETKYENAGIQNFKITIESVDSSFERFVGGMKVLYSFNILTTFNGENTMNDKFDLVIWLNEKGNTFVYMFIADENEYTKFKPDFLQSVESFYMKPQQTPKNADESGGGCLIATAAYGTELAPQVQLLREVRDGTLYNTGAGTTFMVGFNEFYYTFSPTIADWERQSPLFKEIVKTTISPMLSTMYILNYVDINSEQEMLGYGIGVMLLNIGMYFVAPAIFIIKIQQKFVRIRLSKIL